MTWKEDSRMMNVLQDFTATCRCGHRVRLTNKYKRGICQNCGNMVYLYKEDELRERFKNKLRSKLNENNKNINSTI